MNGAGEPSGFWLPRSGGPGGGGLLAEGKVCRPPAASEGDDLLVYLFDAVTVELDNIVASRPQILTLDEKHAYRALQERLRQRS